MHLNRMTRQRLFVSTILALLVLTPALVSADAIQTNVIPFGFSFEEPGYFDGQQLLGTNGWTGVDDDDNLIIWTTNKFLYAGAYPLNKEEHALAIMLDLVEARQMALAALDTIQTWQTVKLLREWGIIGGQIAVPSEPRQLTLLEAMG